MLFILTAENVSRSQIGDAHKDHALHAQACLSVLIGMAASRLEMQAKVFQQLLGQAGRGWTANKHLNKMELQDVTE